MEDKISLPDYDVRQVIRNMADILNTDLIEEAPELCLEIPEELGSGNIRAFELEHGLGILDVDCLLKKPVPFTLDNRKVQPLKILFNRGSEIVHGFDGTDEEHRIGRMESTMLSCNMKHGHIFRFPADQPVCVFSLEINRKKFESKIDDFLSEMNGELEDVFRDVNGVNLFYHKTNYSLDIAEFIEEFLSGDMDGFMQAVYLEGKAFEILSHFLQNYMDDQQIPGDKCALRQSTVERIGQAVEIVKKDIENHIGVANLASRVGLSKNTLQRGFKVLHKMTVNDFIRHHRIEVAKELIETTDLNVTEISYRIGINSRSYFSKLFKEKYGMTPSDYLVSYRDGSGEST